MAVKENQGSERLTHKDKKIYPITEYYNFLKAFWHEHVRRVKIKRFSTVERDFRSGRGKGAESDRNLIRNL